MTTELDHPQVLRWDPPGPGSWELLADHYPRPITAAMVPFLDVWSRETTTFMKNVGMPLEAARMATVNGLPYLTFIVAGGGKKPPPPWVMKLAMRVVPSLRRAEKRLAEVFEQRPWVAGIAQWYDVDRAAALDRMLAITRLDVEALDDAELADHVRHCEHEMLRSAGEHIALHGHDSVAPGLFAVRAMELGLDLQTATGLLRGASPASRGTSPELEALRAAVAGRSAASLEELAALGPEVAGALDAFLELHGWRIVDGYDVDCVTLGEVPSLVLALALAPPAEHVDDFDERVAQARAAIPAGRRAEFDELRRDLDEARSAYGVRDDNSGILVAWAVGLLRRALLACGHRLVERDRLPDASLAIEATPAELAAALLGDRPVDSAALMARAAHRRSLRAADAPRELGPVEPPPPDDMPGALGLFFKALLVFGLGTAEQTESLQGMGIGDTSYRGRARLVTGCGQGFDRFEPGDVLVAPMTSPSYNVLFSLAGAVVTEEGGAMSHAAIMSRELGLPAVIGAPGATTLLADGDLVTVDPVSGRVIVEP
jgi:rifampicin phosphotransferase